MKKDEIIIKRISFSPDFSSQSDPFSEFNEIKLCPGETLIVVGPNNSGKTAFAYAIAGINNRKKRVPCLIVNGEDFSKTNSLKIAETISIVPSNPTLTFSLLSRSLKQEIALCWAFLGRKIEENEIVKLLENFQLSHLSDRNPMSLSGGEKIRAAVAIAVAKSPKVLILDDIFDELNPISKKLINKNLSNRQQSNGLIVIKLFSRAPDDEFDFDKKWLFIVPEAALSLGRFSDCWRSVSNGADFLLPSIPRIASFIENKTGFHYTSVPTSINIVTKPLILHGQANEATVMERKSSEVALWAKDLTFKYRDNPNFKLGPINTSFLKQKITAILGNNGAGKTTLLKCLGNLIRGWNGQIGTSHELKASIPLHRWAREIVYCFQNPEDQFFMSTVKDELKETSKRTKIKDYPIDDEVKRVAQILGIEKYILSSPLSLPRPIQRLVALGSAFVAKPNVLLLDEPTSGLDLNASQKVAEMLFTYVESGGTPIMISHDYNFVSETADNIMVIEDGFIFFHDAIEKSLKQWPGNILPAVPEISKAINAINPLFKSKDLINKIELA